MDDTLMLRDYGLILMMIAIITFIFGGAINNDNVIFAGWLYGFSQILVFVGIGFILYDLRG